MNQNRAFPYEDILHLSRPEPRGRARMPMSARAAQFAPFAALSGYDDAIQETGRLTEAWRELSEEEMDLLNARHRVLMAHLAEEPEVRITCFVPDAKKEGGRFITRTGRVTRVDVERRRIHLAGDLVVPMDRVCAMDGALFEEHNEDFDEQF